MRRRFYPDVKINLINYLNRLCGDFLNVGNCVLFEKTRLHVMDPPQQNNFYDCGIFLLEYAERFLTQVKYMIPFVKYSLNNK